MVPDFFFSTMSDEISIPDVPAAEVAAATGVDAAAVPAAPPTVKIVRPLSAKPGQTGRQAAAVPRREHGGTFALPDPNTARHRQRVAECQRAMGEMITTIDRTKVQVEARLKELRDYAGGGEIAEGLGFDIEAAGDLLAKLDAVLDAAAPKRTAS